MTLKAITPKVGVFSAVIAVSIGALAFKGVDIAQAAFAVEADPAAAAAPNDTSELTAGEEAPAPAPDEAPPAAGAAPPTPEQCLTTLNSAAEEMGLSSQEIVVLRSLQARRETLDARESGIATREAAAAAAEGRLQEQIAQLKSVETDVQALLAKMDDKRDERMAALVKTYETMKPKDAARIFNGMDDALLTDIAKSMKSATLAAVLSSMDAKRAETLTRMLADLAKPPAGVLTPTSAAPAPAKPVASPA
jgi:flagellar motility protein MotE (MotC chaperone)